MSVCVLVVRKTHLILPRGVDHLALSCAANGFDSSINTLCVAADNHNLLRRTGGAAATSNVSARCLRNWTPQYSAVRTQRTTLGPLHSEAQQAMRTQ